MIQAAWTPCTQTQENRLYGDLVVLGSRAGGKVHAFTEAGFPFGDRIGDSGESSLEKYPLLSATYPSYSIPYQETEER